MELFNETASWMVAMGKTIVHSLWIGLLVLGILRIAFLHIPAKLPRLRYGVSVSALLLLSISILAVFLQLYDPVSIKPEAAYPGTSPSFLTALSSESYGSSLAEPALIFSIFTYIYLAGALFMFFRSLLSVNYLQGLRRSSTPPVLDWQGRFESLRHRLGIKEKIGLYESKRAAGPVLVGIFKPMVIVPAGMLTSLPFDQLETILLHELYHLKRKDHLLNIVQLFLEGLLFYNPAVWIISEHIRREREHCCDDAVLHACESPLVYARALVHIAENKHFTSLSPGAAGSGKHAFSSRVTRILNMNNMKTTMRDRIISLALLAGSLVLLVAVSGFSGGSSIIRFNSELPDTPAPLIEETEIAADTIPVKKESREHEEAHHEALEEIEEIDWDAIKEEMEDARQEVLEEIDEIDWDEIREEMESARLEALEEIEEIDWEKMKMDMDSIRIEIEEIDWDQVRLDVEKSMSEMKLDLEEMKIEIENSINEIDWDAMRKEMEESMKFMDSLKIELNR